MVTQPSSSSFTGLLLQDSLAVAPRLLGCKLISHAGGPQTGGIIVEVEAYHGAGDPASHAYRGHTPRTSPMFEAGGTIYVYLSYGIHTCVNLTTGPAGEGQAVLIRALEPTIGRHIMAARRAPTRAANPIADLRLLTSGPGRLTQALGLGLDLSGTRLGGTLQLLPPEQPTDAADIATGPRIGITKATDRPWRFYLRGNPFVSGRQL